MSFKALTTSCSFLPFYLCCVELHNPFLIRFGKTQIIKKKTVIKANTKFETKAEWKPVKNNEVFWGGSKGTFKKNHFQSVDI